MFVFLNAFTTGNPFSETKLLGFSIGRGFGVLTGLRRRYCIPWYIMEI